MVHLFVGRLTKRSLFSARNMVLFLRPFSNQVTACWQWVRFLYGNLRHGKAPLLLNLGETSIRFFMKPRHGLCVRRKMMHASDLRCGRNVSKAQQRSAMTYIGLTSSFTWLLFSVPACEFCTHNIQRPVSASFCSRFITLRASSSSWPPSVFELTLWEPPIQVGLVASHQPPKSYHYVH